MRELIRRLGQVALLLGLGAVAVFGLLIWRAMEGAATGIASHIQGLMLAGGAAAVGAFSLIATSTGGEEETDALGNGGDGGDTSPDGDAGASGGGDSGGGDGGGE